MKVLISIGGPTASGKTNLAVRLALELGTEIISFDSRQIYKELNIGVAKPDKEELRSVRHHFIDHTSVHDAFDAAQFEKQALTLLDELFDKRDIVVAVGGTGLYINALLRGLDDIPDIDPVKGQWVEDRYKDQGLQWLQDYIIEHDLPYSRVVDMENSRRLVRAAKVIATTGKKFSEYLRGEPKKRNFRVLNFYLNPERSVLYENINKRVDRMMDEGLLNEVTGLLPHKDLKALQTVGYRELFDYLEGKNNLEYAVSMIKQNSRRYAKRQFTWFKNQGDWIALDPIDADKNLEIIKSKLNDLEG